MSSGIVKCSYVLVWNHRKLEKWKIMLSIARKVNVLQQTVMILLFTIYTSTVANCKWWTLIRRPILEEFHNCILSVTKKLVNYEQSDRLGPLKCNVINPGTVLRWCRMVECTTVSNAVDMSSAADIVASLRSIVRWTKSVIRSSAVAVEWWHLLCLYVD